MPHPVVVLGWAIDQLDHALNNKSWSEARRRAAGVFAISLLVVGSAALGWLVARVLLAVPLGWILEAAVARVRAAFAGGGLDEARRAVSAIVGRDPTALDETGVCRAAIETTAENFSD